MLTVLSPRFKNIILFAAVLLGVSVTPFAYGDATTCFNFLDAQDYQRAENEAKQLLQRGNLERVDERLTQLCLGEAYSNTGRNLDALPAFQRVEALSQTTKELSIAYNWLGGTYHALNDLDRAELYSQRALKIVRELGDKKSESTMLNNLALAANKRGDAERALKLYRESLTIMPQLEQATTLNNIALIHIARKEYKSAITLLRQAIKIDRGNGDTHQTARWQINLGSVLNKDKQYASAEKELLAGLNAIRLVGDKGWEAVACEKLGWLASANPNNTVGDPLEWMSKAKAIYREIGDTAGVDRIAKLLAGK